METLRLQIAMEGLTKACRRAVLENDPDAARVFAYALAHLGRLYLNATFGL